VIEDKFVDLYARNSGLRDKLVAERDVVLTYALRALLDAGIMDHLAFKGGTCLRKLIFGSAGRFSEDLDFTLDSDRPDDDVLMDTVRRDRQAAHRRRSRSWFAWPARLSTSGAAVPHATNTKDSGPHGVRSAGGRQPAQRYFTEPALPIASRAAIFSP
jgi:predicted nucleotidyltransferase component of viral defense system